MQLLHFSLPIPDFPLSLKHWSEDTFPECSLWFYLPLPVSFPGTHSPSVPFWIGVTSMHQALIYNLISYLTVQFVVPSWQCHFQLPLHLCLSEILSYIYFRLSSRKLCPKWTFKKTMKPSFKVISNPTTFMMHSGNRIDIRLWHFQ